MNQIVRYPLLVFVVGLVALWLSAQIGLAFRKRRRHPEEAERDDFGIVVAAALTLLALIIGFSFSMASNRYDQRKNLEELEANAIGTEYVRADFLPAANAARVRTLLANYLDQRVLFYETRDNLGLRQIDVATVQLESDLWSNVQSPAAAWGLMVTIAICCNLLVGYGTPRGEARAILLLILPFILSISFALIANIDSPRGGVVRVYPQNLVSLSQSLHAR